MSVWYRAGTVAVTNGSKTVTGTNTQWLNLMFGVMPGTTFYGPDGKPYEIDRVVSDTGLLLITNYSGATASAQTYSIDPTRSGSVASLAAQTSEVLKFSQEQFTQMQTWVTGAANVDVALKAPSGQTVVVPSWRKISDTVEGQVAVAKQEADRAKAEAERAVTEADRAAGIVAAAALPLPDVWAPLSDSLRLITGYGRDVLVGSDVVARMVNFSRNSTATYTGKDGRLKTAAANEPRFEREGLLIEGQSQNIIPISDFPQNLAGWVTPNPAGNVYSSVAAPDGSNNALKVSFSGDGLNQSFASLVVGATYTFSFYAKNDSPTPVVSSIRIGSGGSPINVEIPANTDWARYQVTQAFATGDTLLRWYFPTKNIEVSLWGSQLEALPFASSYIPTSGAAATRAQDICWIPVENNGLPGLNNEKTVSLTSNIIGIRGSFNFILSTPWGGIDYTATNERVSGSAIALNVNTPVVLKTAVRKAARFTKGGGCSAVFGGIKKDGPTADWSIGTTRIMIGSTNASAENPHFGHVKDLKIWLKPLSDDQMKAIA